MEVTFTSWNPVDYINDAEDAAATLSAAAEYHDPEFFLSALGDVARAYSMGKIADAAGVSRESLYRSLSATGNPRFATVMKALTAMGLELQVVERKPHPDIDDLAAPTPGDWASEDPGKADSGYDAPEASIAAVL